MNKTRQVIVIDDSKAMLGMLESILNDLGYRHVNLFSCPVRALEELQRYPKKYGIVLTDLNMPNIDGMGVIRELGNMHFTGGVCIISDLDERIIELAAEVARQQKVCLLGTISKPIKMETLRLILNRMNQIEERKFIHYKKMSKEDLITCIEHHQIVPYYQPKLNLENNVVEGLEVLARIQRPGDIDAILPGQFIPTAMKYDLIDSLTMELAETTATHLNILSEIFGDNVKISINLSPAQLKDLTIPDRLEALFNEHNIDNSRIVLEITEEYALTSSEQMESLNRLRIRGYGLSLDDFGTGFTNIQQLRNLPFTEVKIDRTLIDQIHDDEFSQAIVSSLSDIAKTFDIHLVAEGVEHTEELDYIISNHPEIIIQGFLICRPKPIEHLNKWYKNWLKNVATTKSSDAQTPVCTS